MKKFVMFQQNYMKVFKMADNLGVSVLLVKRVFSGRFNITMKQQNLDADLLQFVFV